MFSMHKYAPKLFFGRALHRTPLRELYDVPPEPVVGWGGDALSPLPFPQRLRPLDLGAFGLRFVLPQYKFLATRLHATHSLGRVLRLEIWCILFVAGCAAIKPLGSTVMNLYPSLCIFEPDRRYT